MKRLYITLLIAVIAMVSQDVIAKRAKTSRSTIPFEKLVTMIATGEIEKENALSIIGLKIISKSILKTEYGRDISFVYGRNIKATKHNWPYISSIGPHAFAVEYWGNTDSGTEIYYKEKADHDTFWTYARKSKYYSDAYGDILIGYALIISDEYRNGWYIISVHIG